MDIKTPYLINADASRLQQVFWNLLKNAIKFTPEGGSIQVTVSLVGKQVQTCVEDTGIGIQQDQIKEIFEPFYQLDGSSTRSQGGTGLGLTLVKKILEAHDQTISVISNPGIGSAFLFCLDHVINSE